MFCAGILAGGTDACQDDSGGPIGIDGISNTALQFTLTEAVSWCNRCGDKDQPGVYADLRKFFSLKTQDMEG